MLTFAELDTLLSTCLLLPFSGWLIFTEFDYAFIRLRYLFADYTLPHIFFFIFFSY